MNPVSAPPLRATRSTTKLLPRAGWMVLAPRSAYCGELGGPYSSRRSLFKPSAARSLSSKPASKEKVRRHGNGGSSRGSPVPGIHFSQREMTEVQKLLDNPYSLRLKELSQSCHNALVGRYGYLILCGLRTIANSRGHHPISNSRISIFDISDSEHS